MRLILVQKGLGDLNPMAILNRGYSIAFHLPEKTDSKRDVPCAPGGSSYGSAGGGTVNVPGRNG